MARFTGWRLMARDRAAYLWVTYGITPEEYDEILAFQGGVCAICQKEPVGRHFDVDHEHVRGYKAMIPEHKRRYVRGIACWSCNKFRINGHDVQSAAAVLAYLRNPPARKVLK